MNNHSIKKYACSRCGFVTQQKTNHFGSTWNWGRVNVCPQCPPWAKYPEFGGHTLWYCIENDPNYIVPPTLILI
jgi:hypothetical protein